MRVPRVVREPDAETDLAERPPGPPVPQQVTPLVRRRPRRMGDVVDQLGQRATATPGRPNVERVVADRARAEKGRAIDKGGYNKGEKLGFGATAGKSPPETSTAV
jgi:hypothetical protein